MKRIMMVGGVVVLALGAFAFAQMAPGEKAVVESSISAPAEDQGVDDVFAVPDPRSEEERQADDDFFSIDLGPKVDVSGIERAPSAADNQLYRTCEKTPQMWNNLNNMGAAGNRAYRDIAGYLSVINVISTRDCTCEGKIVPHEAVSAFERKLHERLGVEVLEPKHTSDLYDEYVHQKAVVAAMCGEY